jgi:EF hand
MANHRNHRNLSILAVAALAGALPILAASAQEPDGPGPHGPHGPRGWEGFAEQHDVNGDGQVTRDELVQTLDLFDRVDANGDGVLTESDFEAKHTDMAFGFAAHRADENRDHQVTTAEWDAWFAARDTNGDGKLTAEDRPDRPERSERGERARRGPRPGGPGAEKLAEALDADGDGDVTRADFAALTAQYDENGDGILSEDELPQPPHRGHHGQHGRRGRR